MADLICAECGKKAPRRHHRQKYCRSCAEKRKPRKVKDWKQENPERQAEYREKFREKVGKEAVNEIRLKSVRRQTRRKSLEEFLQQARRKLP